MQDTTTKTDDATQPEYTHMEGARALTRLRAAKRAMVAARAKAGAGTCPLTLDDMVCAAVCILADAEMMTWLAGRGTEVFGTHTALRMYDELGRGEMDPIWSGYISKEMELRP